MLLFSQNVQTPGGSEATSSHSLFGVEFSSPSGEHGELRGGVAAAGQPEEHRGRQLLVHEQAAGRHTGLGTHATIEQKALIHPTLGRLAQVQQKGKENKEIKAK